MIERPELMVVTGIPNHGKGQFIRCLAFNLARAHGWKTAFLAQEDPAHRIQRDALRYAQRDHLELYSGRYQRSMTTAQQRASEAWVGKHFFVSMMPDDEPVTMEMVESEMEAAVFHNDCQVFVLDPWNEVEHHKNKGEPETEYIERSLRRLLRKTRRLNLLLIIAAHPTKLHDGDKPCLYTISGSANWKNKCQHGVIIHKPSESSNGVEITVEKSKDWETMGTPGSLWMEFNREKCDYFSVS
jgi:twinkle protein